MPTLPTVFDLCQPRAEILAGELPDSIFAADLWDVVRGKAHADYLDPERFFDGTHPTENLKKLVKDVSERLAGIQGVTPFYKLETGFGGGKTHGLIAAVHAARHGAQLADKLRDYGVRRFPEAETARIAAFVGEDSDPLQGIAHDVGGETIRTFTPWGQLALMAGGLAGYREIQAHDESGIAPSRSDFERALGDGPLLILIDELVLYMARCFALTSDHPRSKVNSQWPTFLQTLSSVAAQRAKTMVLLTLPTEQDANARFTAELKQYVSDALTTMAEAADASIRQASSLTPTQSTERAAVLARRLFARVDASRAADVAAGYVSYLEAQRAAGVPLDNRAFESGYLDQLRVGYPFHPEFIRLFAERLADIPEFQATRGALRLVGRTIRGVWARKNELRDVFLLQPHHVDLTRGDVKDELLARLGRGAFERGLEADVVAAGGGTHAGQVEAGWPWEAATEASLVTFMHSLPDGSRGVTPSEVALAVGRPSVDLGYVARGLEETERRAWYMRREGDHFLFRTRASINKRFQERLGQVQGGEVREALDSWVQEVFSGFSAFQVIPFPKDHTAIADSADKVRLGVIHYDIECGAVGQGDRLNFTKKIFTTTGVNESARRYRNNLIFLLAEVTRVAGLKDAVRSLIAWERVLADIETEQSNLAQSSGSDYRALKDLARRGAAGVPAEFVALENDLGEVREKQGTQELNVRTRLLEAYRVLAFPRGGDEDSFDLFASSGSGPLLECYRVDFGERPDSTTRGRRSVRQAVAELPILQCLRENSKLVPEATPENPLVLAPDVVKRPPLWKDTERKVSTEEIWDRLRREPALPMVLKQTDLLPTFRAGLTTEPDARWVYYSQAEKKVFTRDTAQGLSPIIAPNHFLYDVAASIGDRIVPVASVSTQEVWDHLWKKTGTERQTTITTQDVVAAAVESAHFPVLPGREVLWNALQDGARENRWVLYLRGPNLAIGAQEMGEWPGTPRFDTSTELWTYQGALDQGIYPRQRPDDDGGDDVTIPLTPAEVRTRCWPSQADVLNTEDLERAARSIWTDLARPRLEQVLLEGLRQGVWCVWRRDNEETFFTSTDPAPLAVRVGAAWVLVDPTSEKATELDQLRPGRGPQPVTHSGTPREALTKIWEDLGVFRNVALRELVITASDRDTLDNTLTATWADRPAGASAHVSLQAAGEREVDGKLESVNLAFEGRFEELRALLSPIWPFARQGELDATIAVRLTFEPPVSLDDGALDLYRTAVMNANQGTIEARAVPTRKTTQGNT